MKFKLLIVAFISLSILQGQEMFLAAYQVEHNDTIVLAKKCISVITIEAGIIQIELAGAKKVCKVSKTQMSPLQNGSSLHSARDEGGNAFVWTKSSSGQITAFSMYGKRSSIYFLRTLQEVEWRMRLVEYEMKVERVESQKLKIVEPKEKIIISEY